MVLPSKIFLCGVLFAYVAGVSFGQSESFGTQQMLCELAAEPIPEDTKSCMKVLQGPPGEVDYRKVNMYIDQEKQNVTQQLAKMEKKIVSLESKMAKLSTIRPKSTPTWSQWWQESTKSALVCERSTLQLRCGPEKILKIKSASYGRSDSYTCGGASKWSNRTQCNAKRSVEVLKTACEKRQSCTVRASNSVFGDPCPRTFKYLKVSYQCSSIRTSLVCEHKTLNLNCPRSQVIKITSASYGRSDKLTCGGPVKTIQCHTDQSKNIVQALCENRQSCSVKASNTVFKDPCVGTFKYLKVEHKCVTVQSPARTQSNQVCERRSLALSCRPGELINIVSASYGRSDKYTCRGPIENVKCHAHYSKEIVSAACENRQSCVVPAHNSVFGDPCVGTYKYLRVRHRCVPVSG